MPPGPYHRKRLAEAVEQMAKEGWRVVAVEGKVPDAIAVKDGRVVAVEVLGQHRRAGKGWRGAGGWTFAQKRREYAMFDDVRFFVYRKK